MTDTATSPVHVVVFIHVFLMLWSQNRSSLVSIICYSQTLAEVSAFSTLSAVHTSMLLVWSIQVGRDSLTERI